MRKTFWERARKFTPVLVRLLAREKHGPPISTWELVRLTGMSPHHVMTISASTDWSCCDVETMRRFLSACQVDFENPDQMDRVYAYMRIKGGPTWKYLRTSPDWNYYQNLIALYRQSILKPQTKR